MVVDEVMGDLAACPCGSTQDDSKIILDLVNFIAFAVIKWVGRLLTQFVFRKEKIQVVIYTLDKRQPQLGTALTDMNAYSRDSIVKSLESGWKSIFGLEPHTANLINSMKATLSQRFPKTEAGVGILKNQGPLVSDDIILLKSGTFSRKPEYELDPSGTPVKLGKLGPMKVPFASIIAQATPEQMGKKRKGERTANFTSKVAKINSLEFRRSLPGSLPVRLGASSSDVQKTFETESGSSIASAVTSPQPNLPIEETPKRRAVAKPPAAVAAPAPSPAPAKAQPASTPSPAPPSTTKVPRRAPATPLQTPTPPPPSQPATSQQRSSSSGKSSQETAGKGTANSEELVVSMSQVQEMVNAAVLKTIALQGGATFVTDVVASAHSSYGTRPSRRIGGEEGWITSLQNRKDADALIAALRERDQALKMAEDSEAFAKAAMEKATADMAARQQMEEALQRAERDRDAAIAAQRKEEEESGKLRQKIKVMSQIIQGRKPEANNGIGSASGSGSTTPRFEYKPK
ncbi:hypothetical protein HDU97_010188 [Phlyctochytrium planicorne]|nr:hypothetical protein HDU97_010188 [Phlyctochytrium planicorne]